MTQSTIQYSHFVTLLSTSTFALFFSVLMYIKKCTSDWLKTSAFSNSVRAAEIYIILSWLSVMFFHVYYLQVKTWFLVQFSIVSTFSMLQRLQLALALGAHAILLSSKNLFVLIKTKWHPKSCYYLYYNMII